MSKLGDELHLLTEISCKIGKSDFASLEEKIMKFKVKSFETKKLYECILQCYLFCGFPAAIESLRIFRKYFKNFASKKAEYDISKFRSAGRNNCKLIYKMNYKKLIDNMNKLSPDLKEWMIVEGYGKVMNRKGLTLFEREFINISILAAGYYENQLHSHLKGCMYAGASKDNLFELLENLKSSIGNSNYRKTIKLIDKIKI